MGYVDSNLMQGETIAHRARLHKILFLWPFIISVAFVVLAFWLYQNAYKMNYVYLSLIFAIIVFLPTYIKYQCSEFAVTNKRVIVKIGLIQRQTVETLLQKIEAISVDQSIAGRILNFGTITIVGTGGTREFFENIADPLGFRRAVQEQTDAQSNPVKNV